MKNVPIIIGGFYRSGTSLVRRLLDSHTNIHCPPEIKWFKDFYSNYLNDELAHVRFFKTVRFMGLSEDELLDIYGQAYIKSRDLACVKLGKMRWADKNPENVLYLKQWEKMLNGEMIFLYVVRNPLDSLASLNEVGFKKAVPVEFEKKVHLFKEYYSSALDYLGLHKDKCIVLKYEELVSRPEEALKQLTQAIDEPYELSMLTNYASPMRQEGIEDPKVIKTDGVHDFSVGRWVSDLSEYQVGICRKELAPFFDYFDYDF